MKKTTLARASTGLAGALAIAGGSQAYGSIVMVPPPSNIIPASGMSGLLAEDYDINGNGTIDITLAFEQFGTNGTFYSGLYGNGGVGVGAAVGYRGPHLTYANRLTAGTTISASSAFAQSAYYTVMGVRYNGVFSGPFVTGTGASIRGFLGFEFTEADGLHFGAIDVSVAPYVSADNPGGMTFYGAEYQSVAGAPLVIAATVPEPTSLAALAFGVAGAAGVALRRRNQAKAAESLPA